MPSAAIFFATVPPLSILLSHSFPLSSISVSHDTERGSKKTKKKLTHNLHIILLRRARGAHGVRLPGAGLAVGQERDIIALGEGVDTIMHVLPDSLLGDVGSEDAVEDEEFPALGRIDGQARR